MYGDSIKLYVRLIKYVLVFVGVELANQIFAERASGNSATYIISFINASSLCFIAHQSILLSERHAISFNYQRLMLRFSGGLLAMFAIGIVPAIVVVVILISQMSALLDEEMTLGLIFAVTVLGMLFVALVVLPLFGTYLSALVMQDEDRGVGAALARGRRTFFFAASRMLAGPVVVYALGAAITLANMDMLVNDLLSESWQPDIAQILFLCGLYPVQALSYIMGSWILCHAYLRAQPERTSAVFE